MAFTTTFSTACLSRSRSTRTSTPSASCSTLTRMLAASAWGRARSTISFTRFAQRHDRQVQFHRPREIEEGLHHAVQTQDLARDDLHLRLDVGIPAGQLGARHLHVQEDGVERVLHLVRHAARNAARWRPCGRPSAVRGRSCAAPPDRAGAPAGPSPSARRRERSPACPPKAEPRPRRPPSPVEASGTRRLRTGRPVCAACATSSPSVVPGGKDFGDGLARQIGAPLAQELLHRAGGEHQPLLAVEDEDGVLQVLQQAVDIAAQVRNLVLRPAQSLAQQADLGGHHRKLVGRLAWLGSRLLRLVFALGHQVQHAGPRAAAAGTSPPRTGRSG